MEFSLHHCSRSQLTKIAVIFQLDAIRFSENQDGAQCLVSRRHRDLVGAVREMSELSISGETKRGEEEKRE
ncbi:hypothetical protein L484_021741 [Morus notabilis]|uniref:Uncharacterized protein n=1 Tax=Morus notabilis TaxID=981085 RepID=W9SKQ3_9ROSA|nr:hypothetical protein L484_021741 [Morus notabilis]